ncbi:Vacuolar ATPase assembly integral membrane protein VMA21 [Hordeum vulgare]|nr:Vacuolar ATPase assembly integral membrane protein VMA21 [Hordeum vulgare]
MNTSTKSGLEMKLKDNFRRLLLDPDPGKGDEADHASVQGEGVQKDNLVGSPQAAPGRPKQLIAGEAMSGAITKFAVTSMVMWMDPVAIMYGFIYHIFPGVGQLSASAQTMASGFLAVISVNLVISFYIYMAMKEAPHQEPQPDPTFLANAKASINQPTSYQKAWEIGSQYAQVESEKNKLKLECDAMKNLLEDKDVVLANLKKKSEAEVLKLADVEKLKAEKEQMKTERDE